MKKILFLVTQSEFGGAQRYIFEIARALNPRTYNIIVAAGQGDNELFQKLKDTQVEPMYLKRMERTPWPWQAILAIGEIYNLLKRERPDVLFLCSTTAGLLGSIAGFFYKKNNGDPISIIYRIGGWAFNDPRPFWQNWLILLAEKLTAPLKDKIVVNSEFDRNLALKYKIASPSKIIRIYNGIDANSLDFLSKEQARSWLTLSVNQAPVVGTVANFYKTKGLEYLIKAMAKSVGAKHQQTKLVIIGEGRERPKLEALIKKYGLENKVILAGRIPDAHKYLKAFDVFVIPSLKEGFPWVILEAIAAGIPIVATRVGAVPEIIEEEFLVKPGDAEDLAKKISQILERQTVPKLKQQFSLQTIIEETEKLF